MELFYYHTLTMMLGSSLCKIGVAKIMLFVGEGDAECGMGLQNSTAPNMFGAERMEMLD